MLRVPDYLPLSAAIAVACRDIDVRNVKALVVGPHETPYEFGFYEVPHFLPFTRFAGKSGADALKQFAVRFNRGEVFLLHSSHATGPLTDGRVSLQGARRAVRNNEWGHVPVQPQHLCQR